MSTFSTLPLSFVENRGQVAGPVAYYVAGQDKTLYFTREGVTLALTGKPVRQRTAAVAPPAGPLSPAALDGHGTANDGAQRWVLKLDFIGADPRVEPTGQDPTPARVSYFTGPRAQWKTGLRTCSSVVYPNLWPGIDLVYTGTVNRLKYTFVVKPGADPRQIRLGYRGATGVRVNQEGELEVSTPVGAFHDDRLYAYQEIDGQRVEVATAYDLTPGAAAGEQRYRFRVAAYDKSKPLMLDPAVLVYCGYIGGSGDDECRGIAVDGAGNAYVTGQTTSTKATFPVTAGPDPTYNGGSIDVFVAKVKADGTGLIYCGYIGGAGNDRGDSIAVDGAGNAYITGFATSSEATFPVTVGPGRHRSGGIDAFVAKVNATGTALLYCGYIGGSGVEEGLDIAVDSVGSAYVAGLTSSSEATFPAKVGPGLTYKGGPEDAFVAKVRPDGTGLVYCGYIGGSGDEVARGIAVDSAGNAYVAGWTTSTEATFPVKVGPDLAYNGGSRDAFVAKVDPSGTTLDYCGYIGGNGDDVGYGVAEDSSGHAYVTGAAASDATTFPVVVGPSLTFKGVYDAFVAKVNLHGTGLDYCGYIGGADYDDGLQIAVDSSGDASIFGDTSSSQATFPVAGGPGLTYSGGIDAFVAKVNNAGTALLHCGYIGGSGREGPFGGIALDSSGNAYVAGITTSARSSFPVFGGPGLTYSGGEDGFVAKITEIPPVISGLGLEIFGGIEPLGW